MQRLQRGDDVIGTGTHHHGPQRQGVEAADQQYRQIRGPRNGAFGILGFLAVERCRLETDKGGKAEQQTDRRVAAADMRRRECISVDAVCPATAQYRHIEHHDRDVLGDHGNRQHAGREVDVAVAKAGNQPQCHRRTQPPRHLDAEHLGQAAGDNGTKQAIHTGLQHVVRDHRQHPCGTAGQATQAAGNQCIETAGMADMPGHPGVARRKAQQHHQGCNQ
ncbi:hypothetical protein D3C76_910730 [compost metagenome]